MFLSSYLRLLSKRYQLKSKKTGMMLLSSVIHSLNLGAHARSEKIPVKCDFLRYRPPKLGGAWFVKGAQVRCRIWCSYVFFPITLFYCCVISVAWNLKKYIFIGKKFHGNTNWLAVLTNYMLTKSWHQKQPSPVYHTLKGSMQQIARPVPWSLCCADSLSL